MKNRLLIMFLIASLVLAMFVCISPTTVYAETPDTEGDQSESLGDTLGEEAEAELLEALDSPFGKIVAGLAIVFAGIMNAITAAIGTIIALIAGIGTFLWGIVEFFIGLFQ